MQPRSASSGYRFKVTKAPRGSSKTGGRSPLVASFAGSRPRGALSASSTARRASRTAATPSSIDSTRAKVRASRKASSPAAALTIYSRGRVSGLLSMPFPEAVERLLNKKICMNCSARNPPKAVQCRRCGYKGLRVKSRERSGKTQ